jgi:magnesium transporter
MEKRQVDKNLIKQIKKWIQEDTNHEISLLLESMYAQDIAEVVNGLPLVESRLILTLVEKEKLVKVLVEIEEPNRESFFESFSPFDIANEFIEKMDSDDAVYVLSQLPEERKDEVINKLTDIEYASQLLSLLSYKEYTAGSLMAVELVKSKITSTVAACIEEIRAQAENVDTIYVVYITDEFERLVGLI